MGNSNLAKVEEVFHEAMSYHPGDRVAYLSRACEGDAVLRREVESLVTAYESGSGLLDETAVTLAMKVIGSHPDDSMVGQEIGVYRIVSCLGQGGMGTVYLAEDLRLHRKVALKFLSSDFISDTWAKRQLIREAQAVAMLDHPNICAVYGFEEIGDYSFIVMQYIEGETLADLIRGDKLKSTQIVPLAQQIVSALGTAHAHGIIHRDIKPKNIMVTPGGHVKVLDFGLAKTMPKNLEDVTESISQLSKDGLLVGTIAYMSPEQLRGEKLDYRSDIFSLGTVLYEMACGRNPFAHKADSRASKSNAEVISAIMSGEPQSLRQVSINCPRGVDQIVNKCLRKERDERYQSAPELLIDLDNLQKGIFLTSRASSYRSIRFAGIAAMLLLAIFVGSFIYQRWTSAGHTLAVSPIVCDDPSAKTTCLGPAMTEGLVKALSRRKGLRVVSSSVTPSLFGANAASPQQIGRDLNADLTMFGKITQSEQGTFCTLAVQRVTDGVQVWEKSYPLNPDKVAILQQKVSLETAVELQLPTNEDDKTLLELVAADENRRPDAYDLYLQGRKAWALRDGENLKLAIDDFRRATELEPSYALAYAGLADCYVLLTTVSFGSLAGPDAMPRARWAAREAIKFGDNLAESHNAYGSVLLKGDWDWENAEKEFQRAIAINSDYQPAHLNYSTLLAVTGRMPEALRESELAVNGDPFSGVAIMNYCRTQYQARQFDQANACLDRLAQDQPNFAGGKYMHGIVYIALGRLPEAIQIFEEIYGKDKAYGGAMLGYTYGMANRRADAERILGEMQEYQRQHYLPDQELGIIYLGLNDLDHAFPLFRKAVENKYPPAQAFFCSPTFDRLRADLRYVELAKEVRLRPGVPTSSASVSNSAR
ncbi:MAG TPA: protein kinase [Pyrinomonadaceae bacterium]|nr:protein kinase [Pyrinomonadaceae bacterium]